jgi:hypothetical protein
MIRYFGLKGRHYNMARSVGCDDWCQSFIRLPVSEMCLVDCAPIIVLRYMSAPGWLHNICLLVNQKVVYKLSMMTFVAHHVLQI